VNHLITSLKTRKINQTFALKKNKID